MKKSLYQKIILNLDKIECNEGWYCEYDEDELFVLCPQHAKIKYIKRLIKQMITPKK